MGESYSGLCTAPLIGSIIKRLTSTGYFDNSNIREKAKNIVINIHQESCCQNKCANKIQKISKLVPVIEFL
ncbi:MAG: hypothetical protein M0P49_03585 [Bacilli bacterium]|nr:hypothetical protein [Bacilli bacterium]